MGHFIGIVGNGFVLGSFLFGLGAAIAGIFHKKRKAKSAPVPEPAAEPTQAAKPA